MLDVLLYTTQPFLVLGLSAALEETGCRLARTAADLPALLAALSRETFGVLLIDTVSPVSVEALTEVKQAAGATPVVLWVDSVGTDFVAQAVGMGIRGVLRKNLSLDLQVRCLQKVASGELWVDKALISTLLSTKPVVLSPREQQLANLLAQGLKNKEIAHRLGLGEGTVKVYFSRLFQKVGVTDRFELALYAIERLQAGRGWSAEADEPEETGNPTDVPGPVLTTEATTPRRTYTRL